MVSSLPRPMFIACVLVLLGGVAPVAAQVPNSGGMAAPRNGDRANWPARVNPLPSARSGDADSVEAVAGPSMGASSPTAFGLGLGEAYLASNFQARVRYSADPDGAVAAGLGLGNPSRFLGLQIDLVSFSTLPSEGGAGGLGGVLGVDVKLHRLFSHAFGLALGWESVLTKGYQGVETDGGSNRYAVVSAWIPLSRNAPFRDLALSLGAGTGRFLPERRWVENEDQFGPFGSVALRVSTPVSLVADWTGQDLILGASLAPLAHHALVLNAGVADVLGTTGGTGRARFVASASYAFRYLKS